MVTIPDTMVAIRPHRIDVLVPIDGEYETLFTIYIPRVSYTRD